MYEHVDGLPGSVAVHALHVQGDRELPTKDPREEKNKEAFRIVVSANSGLRFEFDKCGGASEHERRAVAQSRTPENGDSGGIRRIENRMGGLVRCPGVDVFRAAGNFPTPLVVMHINVQEA